MKARAARCPGERRSRRGGAEAGPYASDARARPQSTRTQRPSMAARVDAGGRGEELARAGAGNGSEAGGSGDSEGAAATSGTVGGDLRGSSGGCHEGMSDLVSPFAVLYEDDADAFSCFEMLLRRMRENFQLEGPTGIMKQLDALWKIMELTDTEVTNW